jgi:hypothetical protein
VTISARIVTVMTPSPRGTIAPRREMIPPRRLAIPRGDRVTPPRRLVIARGDLVTPSDDGMTPPRRLVTPSVDGMTPRGRLEARPGREMTAARRVGAPRRRARAGPCRPMNRGGRREEEAGVCGALWKRGTRDSSSRIVADCRGEAGRGAAWGTMGQGFSGEKRMVSSLGSGRGRASFGLRFRRPSLPRSARGARWPAQGLPPARRPPRRPRRAPPGRSPRARTNRR